MSNKKLYFIHVPVSSKLSVVNHGLVNFSEVTDCHSLMINVIQSSFAYSENTLIIYIGHRCMVQSTAQCMKKTQFYTSNAQNLSI
jgi:hypothetical protein